MQLCISKGHQVQCEVVSHASGVANVAAYLMDLVANKLKWENFKYSRISTQKRPQKGNIHWKLFYNTSARAVVVNFKKKHEKMNR